MHVLGIVEVSVFAVSLNEILLSKYWLQNSINVCLRIIINEKVQFCEKNALV